jgi:hypothetical protein
MARRKAMSELFQVVARWLVRCAVVTTLSVMVCLFAGCGAGSRALPSIEFQTVPRAANGGPTVVEPVAGRVRGAKPHQRIVLFTKAGAWWVQPFRSRPFTEIEPDATWKSAIHLGTEYAALLVEPDYRPPVTTDTLPAIGGGVIALATVAGSGTYVPPAPKTLTFAGYEWDIRLTPNERRGQNTYDARNAWVDPEGHLHLALVQRDGHWTSAEVRLMRSLGYGTYMFDLRETSALGPAAFEIYMWDEAAIEQHHRELGVDIGRWGDAVAITTQYVLQPEDIATNIFRFIAPAGRLTHSFRWQAGQLAFKTTRGSGAVRAGAGTTVTERQFTAGVPVPGAEALHMLLHSAQSRSGAPAKDVEVVVEKFAYLP